LQGEERKKLRHKSLIAKKEKTKIGPRAQKKTEKKGNSGHPWGSKKDQSKNNYKNGGVGKQGQNKLGGLSARGGAI